MSELLAIGKGTNITLHFSLSLEDGEVIDSNFEGAPPSFAYGDGNMLPGFEEVLIGLVASDEKEFIVPPEKSFGQPNPNNLQTVSRSSFDPTIELQEGLVVSFAEPSGGELPGVVKLIKEDEVVVDFNHPLAGRNIVFRVKIIDVQPTIKH